MKDLSETKYNIVKNYLLGIINENIGKPKYRLPTEKQLSEMFGCSRITSKYAITLLEKENLVYRIQGSGTYINDRLAPQKAEPSSPAMKTVALLVPDIQSRFMANIVHGIEKTLRENGYTLLLAITDYNRKTEKDLIAQFAKLRVCGFIIYPVDNQVYNTEALKLIFTGYPTVLVDREYADISANSVSSPHEHTAEQAVNYLIENGHRKIGMLGSVPQGTTTLIRRINGYKHAMLSHNLAVNENYLCVNLKRGESNWEDVIRGFIAANRDMTAVFATDSDIGYTLLHVLRNMQISVPQEISVVFCDEEYTDIMPFMNVNPTRIEQKPLQIGRHAAKLLLETIADPTAPPRNVFVSARFIEGNTVQKRNV